MHMRTRAILTGDVAENKRRSPTSACFLASGRTAGAELRDGCAAAVSASLDTCCDAIVIQ